MYETIDYFALFDNIYVNIAPFWICVIRVKIPDEHCDTDYTDLNGAISIYLVVT